MASERDIEVTQADRIAAVADVLGIDPKNVPAYALKWAETGNVPPMMEADADDFDDVQARARGYARHREAATAELRAEVEKLRRKAAFDSDAWHDGWTAAEDALGVQFHGERFCPHEDK